MCVRDLKLIISTNNCSTEIKRFSFPAFGLSSKALTLLLSQMMIQTSTLSLDYLTIFSSFARDILNLVIKKQKTSSPSEIPKDCDGINKFILELSYAHKNNSIKYFRGISLKVSKST